MAGIIGERVPLDDGTYRCYWGGYVVWFDCEVAITVDGRTHKSYPFQIRMRCLSGIRTAKAEALLTVKCGNGVVVIS